MSTPKPTHQYTFPPFPNTPPEGVQVIPFSDFKESGIQIAASKEGLEVDGQGIPTTVLSSKHDTDACKTDARPRKKVVETQTVNGGELSSNANINKLLWWKQWEEFDLKRSRNFYDDRTNPADRLHEATRHFNHRSWPKNKSIREQWDQFQLYIGILSVTPVWSPVQDKKAEDEAESDGEDLFDGAESIRHEVDMAEAPSGDATSDLVAGGGSNRRYKRPRPRPPYENYGRTPPVVSTEEEIQTLFDRERDAKEDRLWEFLSAPAMRVKVYLSSYLRWQGLHYAEHNLDLIPRLIRFYIQFLIRECVFASDTDISAQLSAALEVVEQAALELPLTPKIAKTLPGNFGEACEELFGVREKENELSSEAIRRLGMEAEREAEVERMKREQEAHTDEAADGDVKAMNIDIKTDTTVPVPAHLKSFDIDIDSEESMPLASAQDDEVLFEESLKSGAIHILEKEIEVPTSKVSSTADVAETESLTTTTHDHLGISTADPAPSDDSSPASSAFADPDHNAWAEHVWGSDESTAMESDHLVLWARHDPATLFPFLGPTALPLTHVSGVVEWSMRRIKSISHPVSLTTARIPKSPHVNDPSPAAVEADLDSRLTKLVMVPWIGWEQRPEELEVSLPKIRGSSRGRVVVHKEGEGVAYDDGSAVNSNAAAAPVTEADSEHTLKPHDPLTDEITVLIDQESTEHLRLGMGLGATWVQLARRGDLLLRPEEGQELPKIATSKKSSSDTRRFWYIAELQSNITSYHIN